MKGIKKTVSRWFDKLELEILLALWIVIWAIIVINNIPS